MGRSLKVLSKSWVLLVGAMLVSRVHLAADEVSMALVGARSEQSAPVVTGTVGLGSWISEKGQVVVSARWRDGTGQLVTREEELENWMCRVDEEPYEGEVVGRSRGYKRYIIRNAGGHPVVLGVGIWTLGTPSGGPALIWGGFTNLEDGKDWGFDPGRGEFWMNLDPATLPVRPKLFTWKRWKGLRFAIPLELEKMTPVAAKEIIEWRGGQVVTAGAVDVVVLPDDIDFVWGRNKQAEALVRRGAMVLWEKNFTNNKAEDVEGVPVREMSDERGGRRGAPTGGGRWAGGGT